MYFHSPDIEDVDLERSVYVALLENILHPCMRFSGRKLHKTRGSRMEADDMRPDPGSGRPVQTENPPGKGVDFRYVWSRKTTGFGYSRLLALAKVKVSSMS